MYMILNLTIILHHFILNQRKRTKWIKTIKILSLTFFIFQTGLPKYFAKHLTFFNS